MVSPTNPAIVRAGFTLRETSEALEIFATSSMTKKVFSSEDGAPDIVPYGKSALVIALRSQKGQMRAWGSNF